MLEKMGIKGNRSSGTVAQGIEKFLRGEKDIPKWLKK